jgi:hypothetical protein
MINNFVHILNVLIDFKNNILHQSILDYDK